MKQKLGAYFKALTTIHSKWLTIFLPIVMLGIFILLISFKNVYTETYNIERFTNAKETIRSPITIENELETQRKTREAFQAVKDRYEIQTEVTDERIEYIREIFDAIAKLEASNNEQEKGEEKDKDNDNFSNQEKLQQLKEILSPEITDNVRESVFTTLLLMSPEEREKGKDEFIHTIRTVMENGVRTENMNSAKADVKQSIKYANLDEDVREAFYALSDFAITENSFFDAEKTSEARKKAASKVDPVVIRAGEIIVREGQTITNEIYEELKLVGLLNKQRNIFPVLGLALLASLIIIVIGYEMYILDKQKKLDKRKIASILFISVIVIVLMKVVSLYTTQSNQLFYVVPIATGALLVKELINERLALVLASLYGIIGSIIFNGQIPGSLNVEAAVYFFFSQVAAVIFLGNLKDRLAIIKAGLGIAAINMVTVLLFLFLSFEKYAFGDLFVPLGYGFASAFLSSVLTIGLLPFFETGLGILSDMKLLQLSSPNQPLLRKILTEAPGTYHHSIMVANLSETACEAIGANGLLARVGAYYHDIGKTVRPHYFIENQLAIKNPHDVIQPKQSAEIIISHPYDGAAMLKKHKMPKEIVDIAMQHHGTSLLKFFYYKEKETNKQVTEADFRYPGPKPQTKEAAVICICDAVEAAVRSLKEPTEKKIDEIVSSIVNDRLMDGQLNECPLTIKELEIVHKTVCETLKGIFHSRIQYPMKEAK